MQLDVAEDDDDAVTLHPGSPGPEPAASEWGSSETAIDSRSSSPLSFDWTPSVASVEGDPPQSPTLLAATAHLIEVTEAFAGPITNPLDNLSPFHPLANQRDAPSQASTDYFRFFSPIPDIEDPPHVTCHRLQGASRLGDNDDDDDLGTNAGQGVIFNVADMNPNFVFNGEPVSNPLPHDDARNARKRYWTGSPNPEDTLRARRRQRQQTPSPLRLPETHAGQLAAFNPWNGEDTLRERERDVEARNSVFSPVAVSTPAQPSVRNAQGQPPSEMAICSSPPVTGARPSLPHGPIPTSAPHNLSRSSAADPLGSRTPIPVIGNSCTEDSAEPKTPQTDSQPAPTKRDKGKGRARYTSPEQDCQESRAAPRNEGWCERELHEARQRSMQQALEERTVIGRSEPAASRRTTRPPPATEPRAGPSGTQRRETQQAFSGYTAARPGRDDHASSGPSRRRDDLHENSVYAPEPTFNTGYPHETGELHPVGRLASEYIPAPNTRAAQYIGNHPLPSTRWAAQPSPLHPPTSRHGGRAPLHASPGLFNDNPREYEWSNAADDLGEARDIHMRHGEYDDEDEDEGDQTTSIAREWHLEEGELMPAALNTEYVEDEEVPTDAPEGGFPTVHRDDPEMALRGMARDWTREIWSDAPGTVVLVEVFNYQYSEDDTFNRRVEDAIRRHVERITGDEDFDVVPPEPEDGARTRQRELPTLWAVRGLSQRGAARALARSAWSFPSLSFLTFPRAVTIPSWLFMVEGFLRGDDQKIRVAILRVLQEDDMRTWMERMVGSNVEFAGLSLDQAVQEVLNTLTIETLQLGNGNYVSNVTMRSPTRDVREWRRWVAHLRSRRYRSFSIGTGRVRQVIPCSGCRSVSHPSHLCPFPRTRGWNGPEPGQGVFGDRRNRRDNTRAQEPLQRGHSMSQNARRGSGGHGDRGPRRDDRYTPRTPGRGRDNDQNSRPWHGQGPNNGRRGGNGGGGSNRKWRA